MKQVIRRGLKEIIVDEVPDPPLRPHHVLLRPVYSLISSGTETASIHTDSLMKEVADNPGHLRKVYDVMKVNGPIPTIREVQAKFSEYAVLGYSGAGVVVDVGPGVTDLKPGARVAYGGEGTGHGESILTGRNLVARVPDGVPFEQACFATLGSIAMNAVRVTPMGLGEVVAVVGQGLVGQLVAQLARAQGARVIAIDLQPSRVELAKRCGAEEALIGGAGLREKIHALTNGRGVDCAIIAAAAKSDAPCRQALEITRDRGRLVVVGAVEMSFPWLEMYLKEIQLFMARAYGPGSYDPNYEQKGQDYPLPYVRWTENRNMEEFLRLAGQGLVHLPPLVTHQFALDQAPDAYRTILDPTANSLAVLLRYPAADETDPVAAFVPKRKVEISGAAPTAKGVLQAALVGAGNLARWAHMPNLKKIPEANLRAVYSANGARGKSYGMRFGAAYTSSDYQQILDDRDIDLVVIVSRNQDHAAQALAALKAGKHVFLEKPMCLTMEECDELRQAVQDTGKQLTVGFNRRFAPYYIEVKNQLKRRTGPAVIQVRMNSPGISGGYWMADPTTGGAILGEACHFVDLMYWLLDSEPMRVSAFSLPQGKQQPIGENNLVASFQFADGSIGSLTYSTVGSKTSGGERVEVFAEGIGAMTEDFKRLGIYGNLRRMSSKWFADKGYFELMDSFIQGIRKGTPPVVNVVDGARSTIGCLKMLESARMLSGPLDISL